jgi:biotin carboxylase
MDFNVPGLHLADMAKVKRKSQMKRIFQDAGLDVPAGVLVNTIDEARGFVDRVGYPLVAKPDVGVGAAHTYHLANDDDMETFWRSRSPEPYMLEEYVVGRLHSFDGLTDQDGHIVFHTAHHYEPAIMEVVNKDLDVTARNFRDVPEGLEYAGRRAVAAFDVRERFFHIEFIALPDEGRWLALEMNMRPPGGPMMDVLNYAHDIDLYREWANVVMYNAFTAEVRRPYWCAFVGRKRHRPHRYTHQEILNAVGALIVHTEALPPVFARAMGHQGYILRSADRAELQSAIDFILTPP